MQEGGVHLELTLVDTPGFGDVINNVDWSVCGCCLFPAPATPPRLLCFIFVCTLDLNGDPYMTAQLEPHSELH